jgi:cytochrome c-type biogenesis protein CcsB
VIAALGNTIGFCLRWHESYRIGYGHIPLSNLYESLVFFALTIAVISVFIEWKYKNYIINAFAIPMAFLCMAYASLSPSMEGQAMIQPLIPALKSNWLTTHVVTCFLGYAGFATAFGTSVLYLLKTGFATIRIFSRLPEEGMLDEMTQQTIMFGFLFLTIGIITGSVWANSAWGSYWSWDPKETWSLITWLVYAILLHLRFMKGWDGKRIAIVSLIGFVAVMFTYFGVNYLPGLHSYAKG